MFHFLPIHCSVDVLLNQVGFFYHRSSQSLNHLIFLLDYFLKLLSSFHPACLFLVLILLDLSKLFFCFFTSYRGHTKLAHFVDNLLPAFASAFEILTLSLLFLYNLVIESGKFDFQSLILDAQVCIDSCEVGLKLLVDLLKGRDFFQKSLVHALIHQKALGRFVYCFGRLDTIHL